MLTDNHKGSKEIYEAVQSAIKKATGQFVSMDAVISHFNKQKSRDSSLLIAALGATPQLALAGD